MILLRAATLSVSDLQRSIDLYQTCLDYVLVEHGVIDAALATRWGTPGVADRASAVLRPASGKDIFLRLVEQPAVEGFRALRTFGWNAIEVCVSDVKAVHERLQKSPFEIIGPPRENPGLANIHPMQIKGPDEEVVFLTQINADTPPFRLPRAGTLIDQIFILVIGCSDMAAAVKWFADHVGLAAGEEMEIAYTMLAKAYGKDLSTQYALTTMVDDFDVFLEVDQYPEEATDRTVTAGCLPPGCSLATFLTPDIDSLPGPWICPPATQAGAIYENKRAGTMIGPDGALVEIVEV
jgi:catechol 2,3-dioxygenase-like lactoylglutathione lyase family enzyme